MRGRRGARHFFAPPPPPSTRSCANAAAASSSPRAERGARMHAIARETGAAGVAWSALVRWRHDAWRAIALASPSSKKADSRRTIVHDAPAIAPEESGAVAHGAGAGYRAFAPYFDAWCDLPIASHEQPLLLRFANARVSPADDLPRPTSSAHAPPGRRETGGARAASLERFLRDGAAHYAFAATVAVRRSHVASGAASLVRNDLRADVRARVRERLERSVRAERRAASLRLFLRRLAHRDFFLQLGWFHPRHDDEPLQEKMRGFSWARTHPALDAWRAGKTGFPLVDAGIRQLHETGWMHPHVRAVAASLLVLRSGRRLARRSRRMGSLARRGRSRARDRKLAVDRGRRRRHGAVSANLQSRAATPALRSGRSLRAPLGSRARTGADRGWHGRVDDRRNSRWRSFLADEYPGRSVDHERAAREFLTPLSRVCVTLRIASRSSIQPLTTGTRTSSPFQVLMP